MSVSYSTKRDITAAFECSAVDRVSGLPLEPHVKFEFYKCPNGECERHTIYAYGTEDLQGLKGCIWPPYVYTTYPDYVPEFIRQDYQEACAIKTLSPKASATLARRCLQGMIRDFHGITKNTLYKEIIALKGKEDNDIIDALLALRSIGNIGAHPERDVNLIVDIEPDEAAKLIEFIELLIDEWYIAREKRKALLERLPEISDGKKNPESSLENPV